jgi:flagellar secretion chaperone FliS
MHATSVRPNTPSALTNAYRRIGVETSVSGASAHKLVAMLFDGAQESIQQARGALHSRQPDIKGRAVARAVRIVDEGLRGALNMEAGGTLALDLRDLYNYITLRLTQANLTNDDKALAECADLIEPLRSAWRAIGPQVQAAQA